MFENWVCPPSLPQSKFLAVSQCLYHLLISLFPETALKWAQLRLSISHRTGWDTVTAVILVSAATTALNGEQTHYDYSVLTTKGLNKEKTVKVYKVYSESGKEHVLFEPHTYTSSTLKNSRTVLPDSVSTTLVPLKQGTKGASSLVKTNHMMAIQWPETHQPRCSGVAEVKAASPLLSQALATNIYLWMI